MKKSLIIFGIVAAVVLLPVLGMAISPTRDLLLGLTPDNQILALADKIDQNRVSSEQTDVKILELQSTIDSQEAELFNYQQQIESQNNKIETVTNSVKTTNQTVETIQSNVDSECQKKLASLNKAIKNAEDNIKRTDVSESYIEGNKQSLKKLLAKKDQFDCN